MTRSGENHIRADYEDDEEFENISLPEVRKNGPPPRPVIDSWDEESQVQRKIEKRKEANMLQPLITYKMENLGEDFDETPWVPPTVMLAEEFRKENMFRSGKTKLSDICLTKAQECGTGLPLYFQFLKSMMIALLIMTILAVPSIILNSQGSKISLSDRDYIGLYKLTLGNIGYNVDDANYAKDSACSSGYGVSDNSTCVHVYGYQFTLTTAGEIITLFELLQITVFFLALFYLSWRSEQVTQSTEGRDTVLSDYSIMVRGIPPDTTEKELVHHFSSLYQLKEKDWRKRPPLAEAEVVQQYDNNSRLDCLKGSWIGDITIFRKVGRFLRAYKEEQKLMEELYRCRAFMKMYKDDTKYYAGPQPKKYTHYEKKMLKVGKKMDRITEKLLHRTITSKVVPTKEQETKTASRSADAFAAFVVFNYTESKARCIEDYTVYSNFPWSLFYPKRLRFKGKRLVVSKAPEPDEIIWENLEIPKTEKFCYRILTLLQSVALLIIGFVVILQAAINKESFNNQLPDLTLCGSDIPALFKGSYDLPSSVVMKRPVTGTDAYGMTRTKYDQNCSTLSSSAFYAINTDGGDLSSPIGTYSISACTQTLAAAHSPPYPYYGGCPHYNQTVFCPCVDVNGAETCYSLSCGNHDTSKVCSSFTSSNIAGCYCYSLLKETILSYFSINGILSVWEKTKNSVLGKSSTTSANPCRLFFIRYSTATALTYTAALATVVTNMLLKYIIVKTTKTEYWNSIDIEKGYIINKIFLVTYVNMAFVVLLAFGYAKNSPSVLQETQILQGSYIDFTPSWYGQVGTYLVITLLINIPSQYLLKLPRFLLFKPYQRWKEYPKIEKKSSKKMAMQHDVNMLNVGNVFDSTTNSAFLLANFFFCMTYAPGIPILTPIICAIFGIYFYLDKLLLCRFHQRPPHMSDGANKIILGLLPYAAIIRLAMACWMYGNSNILSSDIANIGIIPGYSSADPAEATALYQDYLNAHSGDNSISFQVISKVVRTNVLPLFVYLVIVVLVILFRSFWRRLPFYWAWRFVAFLSSLVCQKRNRIAEVTDESGYVHAYDLQKLKDPLRMEMAPFTGSYFKYLKRNSEKPRRLDRLFGIDHSKLKSSEIDEGWEVTVTQDDEFTIKVKKFTSATRVGNGVRSKGCEKKTYEVIGDNGCSSYALEDIPAYSIAVRAMKESADQQLSDLAGRTMVERFQNRKTIKVKQSKEKAIWQTNNVNDAKEKVRVAKEKKKQMHTDDYYHAGTTQPRGDEVSDYEEEDEEEEEDDA